MIFKDRAEAGGRLAKAILADQDIQNALAQKQNMFVVSLLRGGFIVGDIVAKELGIAHLPLVAVKISSPYQPELAIGALCFHCVYLDDSVSTSLELDEGDIIQQRTQAQRKFYKYIKTFHIEEVQFDRLAKKTILLIDDGIATGSTIYAAHQFLETKNPSMIVLAIPTAPTEFDTKRFGKALILDKNPYRSSVSQAYEEFPQVEDSEIIQ